MHNLYCELTNTFTNRFEHPSTLSCNTKEAMCTILTYNPQNILNITVPYGNVRTNTHALADWYGSVYTAPIAASSTHILFTSLLHARPLLIHPFENICGRTDQYIYKVEKLLHKSNPPGIRNNKLHVLRISLQYYLRLFQISRNEEKFYMFHIFG